MADFVSSVRYRRTHFLVLTNDKYLYIDKIIFKYSSIIARSRGKGIKSVRSKVPSDREKEEESSVEVGGRAIPVVCGRRKEKADSEEEGTDEAGGGRPRPRRRPQPAGSGGKPPPSYSG